MACKRGKNGIGIEARFWSKVRPRRNGCIEWLGSKDGCGYGHFRIDNNLIHRAHRVSWNLVNGEIPDGLCVCHKCDNPAYVNPEHLFLGTHTDNMIDKESKGRGNQLTGIEHHRTHLTEQDIIIMRQLHKSGNSHVTTSKLYNITPANASHIVHGRRWGHIKEGL